MARSYRGREAIINAELAKYRPFTHGELSALVDAPKRSFEVTGPSGATYYVNVYARWDSRPGGPVRLWVAADDGGLRAILPMVKTFIKSADGSLIDEG